MNRSNLAKESETRRSNLANEAIKSQSNNIALGNLQESIRHNQQQEAIGRSNVAVQQQLASETARSNRARERETQRSNLAREAEINRANLQSESLQRQSNITKQTQGQQNLNLQRESNQETKRHNVQTELNQQGGSLLNTLGQTLRSVVPLFK